MNTAINRKKLMTILINHFGHSELNSALQIVADDILAAQPKQEAIEPDAEQKNGALVKRFGEVIVEMDKLKKKLEQEQFNHTNTRRCWDATLEKMDKLKPESIQGDAVGFDKDLIIEGITEGAELWKAEYDNCRALLDRLVILKECKDANINMEEYAVEKPKAWESAKKFLQKYQHL